MKLISKSLIQTFHMFHNILDESLMTYPHESLYPYFTHNRQHVYCGGVIILRTLDTGGNNFM